MSDDLIWVAFRAEVTNAIRGKAGARALNALKPSDVSGWFKEIPESQRNFDHGKAVVAIAHRKAESYCRNWMAKQAREVRL